MPGNWKKKSTKKGGEEIFVGMNKEDGDESHSRDVAEKQLGTFGDKIMTDIFFSFCIIK